MYTSQQYACHIQNTKDVLLFTSWFVLHFITMNPIIVSKNDLQCNCLLKLRHLDVVFGILFFFGILKAHSFVYVRINFK